MSNSYFTSSNDLIDKLKASQVEGDNGGNFLTNLLKGGLSVDEYGDVQRNGWAYYLQPVTNNDHTDNIARKRKEIADAKTVEEGFKQWGVDTNLLKKAGLLEPGQKITKNNLRSLALQYDDWNKKKITPQGEKDNTYRADSLDVTRDFQQGQLGVQTQALTNAANQSNNQVEIARLDRGYDREALQANTNLQLQLGMLAAEQQDQRLAYDKETRMMDRKDRAIAQILSGLGETASFFV